MEIIGKISKGSKMDQVYIAKNRQGFAVGNYVVIKPLEEGYMGGKRTEKPYLYGIGKIEPLKLGVIGEIFKIIEEKVEDCQNIIISGSFLDEGFRFNDVDVLIVGGKFTNGREISNYLEGKIGVKVHVIGIKNGDLIAGLGNDPLYQMMLSRCVSKKRIIYHAERRVDYKLLDLHLLKSKTLIDGFDILNGNEKYYLTRNMGSIILFLKGKRVGRDEVDREIKRVFGLDNIDEIKENLLNKKKFIKKYKEIYDETFEILMKGIEHGSK